MFNNLQEWLASAGYISAGVFVTLQYAVTSIFLGLILGALLSLARLSGFKSLRTVSQIYVSIFRGTPLLIQLSIVYFATPGLTGFQISAFVAGVTTFSLNSAAYISEIIRAGIASIKKGQFEAAQALGVPKWLMMKAIIFPQAFKNILPALVNEVANLLKESAIISIIGGADLMRRAQLVAAEQYTYFGPLLIAAVCYYVLVVLLSFFAKKLEGRLQRYA